MIHTSQNISEKQEIIQYIKNALTNKSEVKVSKSTFIHHRTNSLALAIKTLQQQNYIIIQTNWDEYLIKSIPE